MSTVRKRGTQLDEERESDGSLPDDEDPIVLSESLERPPEDEELWDEGDKVAQVRIGGRADRDMKRVNKLRKTIAETGLRMVVHLVFLSLYLALHVHNADQFKKCPEPTRTQFFYGGVAYGGLWKYLTHICMWVVGVNFFLAFFTDIMPLSPAKNWFRQLSDWYFTTLAWPISLTVCFLFWAFYLYDPHLIRETPDISLCYPETLNHGLHTLPVICVLAECILVYHSYPSHITACFTVLTAYSSYGIWVLVIFSATNMWVYPILSMTTPLTYIGFMFFFSMGGIASYYVGRFIASIVWKERFEAQYQLDDELPYEDSEVD